MTTTNTIGFLWVYGELPPLAYATLRSFVEHGHDCVLYSYDNPSIPPGCRLRNARELIAEDEIWRGKNNSLACFADLFRWKMMYEEGCFWADMDIFCIKPMPSFAPGNVIYRSRNQDPCPFQGFYRLPAKHPALKRGIDWITAIPRKERSLLGYTAVMDHLCQYFHESAEMETALPVQQIAPLAWDQWRMLWSVPYTEILPLLGDAWQIHMFGEMQRLEPMDSWHKDSIGAMLLSGRKLEIP